MKNKKFWMSLLAGIMAAIMLVTLLLSLLPTEAFAAKEQSSSEIQKQIDALKKDQNALKQQIKDLEKDQNANLADIKAAMKQKNKLDEQIGLLYMQINNMTEQIAAYSVLIADKQLELEAAEERLADLNAKYKERIRTMEEDGKLSYWSVLFQANSFADLLDRLNMIEEIAASDQRRLKELNQAAQEVSDAKLVLEQEKASLEDIKTEQEQAKLALDAKSEEAQAILDDLIARGEEFDNLMLELEDAQSDLSAEIAQAKKDYDAAKEREHLATATTGNYPATGGGNNGGKAVKVNGVVWLNPVSWTRISSAYGWRTHPTQGVKKFHHGVDLVGPSSGSIKGYPIVAARSGKVFLARWYGGGGWTVAIDHLDGYDTYYMHMTHFVVKTGDIVSAGQVIGYVGKSGDTSGYHLHYEIRKNGNSVNPAPYISR